MMDFPALAAAPQLTHAKARHQTGMKGMQGITAKPVTGFGVKPKA